MTPGWLLDSSSTAAIPLQAALSGLQVQTQGAVLQPVAPGCAVPLPSAFSDVWTITIG